MGRGLAGLLALGLLYGCASPGGLRVEGPARPSVSVRQVLVLDYGNHPGAQPPTLWLDEVTAVVELRWSGWGGPQAAATGVLVPAECAEPSCLRAQQPGGVPVRLVLDQPVQRGDTRYYSHAALTQSGSRPDWRVRDYGSVRLPVPAA
jgi:hypothetical protein